MSRFDVDARIQVAIVGTGAGGATAARVLTKAGLDVMMIEEGGWLRTASRPRDAAGALASAMRDGGTQATTGAAPFPLLQASCVGGSTAVNSGIIWRMPENVQQEWRARHGLAWLVNDDALVRAYEEIERDLEVTVTRESLYGGNAEKMAEACAALSLPGKAMVRNAARCEASGECLQGCPGEARQSMDVSYIPRAIEEGARLMENARVDRVLFRDGRAVGVVGTLLHARTRRPTGRFRVVADVVVLAAGAIHTPCILARSGVKGRVGEHFQAHPGAAIAGRFDEVIAMSRGATQGYEVPMHERGFKIESLSLPPELLAARLPGAGARWQRRLEELDQYAQWCGHVRMEAHGTVRPGWFGPRVSFTPTPRDLRKVQDAVALMCEMMFAAGATEVFPGVAGFPEVITNAEQARAIRYASLRPRDLHLVASHLFGTARAGADARQSVVDATLQHHALRELYVMDASVFPTNLGVNPQHSIMAVVHRAASALADRLSVRSPIAA